MRAILGDVNVQGHVGILVHILESATWREIWAGLNLSVLTFADLGLERDATDDVIWQTCQREQAVLITANRNDDGPTSLEATLRSHNTATSLPVLTVADVERVRQSRNYAERVVESLLEYLLDIDSYRGTGRLYLP
jgi:hypothetical protein